MLVPMAMEAWALSGLLARREMVALRGHRLVRGMAGEQQVVLCQAGVGKAAAATARQVLGAYVPEAVVALGLGGAAEAALGRGHIFIARELTLCQGGKPALAAAPHLVELAQEAARRAGLPFMCGLSCTAEAVLAEPWAKEEVARRLGAALVQMEDYWLAQEAQARGLPFLSVRAVVDALHDSLPLTTGGQLDGRRLLRHPLTAGALALGAAQALRNLRRMARTLFQMWR